jgi:hypothetical protein
VKEMFKTYNVSPANKLIKKNEKLNSFEKAAPEKMIKRKIKGVWVWVRKSGGERK